jgi:hypothetical protein
MSEREVPEADALEQAQPVDDPHEPISGRSTTGALSRDDVPEADALEQAQPVDDPHAPVSGWAVAAPATRDDVPEADALDQLHDVDVDDEGPDAVPSSHDGDDRWEPRAPG